MLNDSGKYLFYRAFYQDFHATWSVIRTKTVCFSWCIMNCSKKTLLLAEYVSTDAIIAFARRIRCHVRAPPEYNDPTGMDVHCVPNYFFPCPDRLAMSRTSLYHSDKPRALPPLIHLIKNPNNALFFWVRFMSK
jgi:hypothetical protein